MTLFMSKVWGFDNPCGPLVFRSEGWRTNAIGKLQDGDRVVLVATLSDKPEPENRGRILGMMEPTAIPVSSLDFPYSMDHRAWNNGIYRWPYGLLNRRAWQFPSKPDFARLVPRPFAMDSAAGIVPLSRDEEAAVLAEPHIEIPLASTVAIQAKLLGIDAARRRGAPPPSTTRAGIMHMRSAPAFTYLLALENSAGRSVAHKVGWAFDYKLRMREFNKSAAPTLGGLHYRAKLFRLWDTARLAFGMEQTLLVRFREAQHPDNREILSGIAFAKIEEAWNEYIRVQITGR